MTKYAIAFLLGFIVFTIPACSNSDNALSGKWKSLVQVNANKNLGFNLTFENNNTFHVEGAGGGQTLIISGDYKVQSDTLLINDKTDQPQQCSYSDTGEYTFTEHRDTMLFKTIKDDCEKRKLTLEIGLLREK